MGSEAAPSPPPPPPPPPPPNPWASRGGIRPFGGLKRRHDPPAPAPQTQQQPTVVCPPPSANASPPLRAATSPPPSTAASSAEQQPVWTVLSAPPALRESALALAATVAPVTAHTHTFSALGAADASAAAPPPFSPMPLAAAVEVVEAEHYTPHDPAASEYHIPQTAGMVTGDITTLRQYRGLSAVEVFVSHSEQWTTLPRCLLAEDMELVNIGTIKHHCASLLMCLPAYVVGCCGRCAQCGMTAYASALELEIAWLREYMDASLGTINVINERSPFRLPPHDLSLAVLDAKAEELRFMLRITATETSHSRTKYSAEQRKQNSTQGRSWWLSTAEFEALGFLREWRLPRNDAAERGEGDGAGDVRPLWAQLEKGALRFNVSSFRKGERAVGKRRSAAKEC